MYLIDTNVVSEARKKGKANPGVMAFFKQAADQDEAMYLCVVSVGELRRGVELIRHRGDIRQSQLLESWLTDVLANYAGNILAFDAEAAQVWGRLREPHAEHELDKQIAAIALINGLTVVTRNTADFEGTGVKVMNPFQPVA